MILNHVDLQVSDVAAARAFFEVHFGLRCTDQRGDQIAMLEDEDGFCFGVSNLQNRPPPVYPPDFHVGFVLNDVQQVLEIYSRIKDANIAIKFDLRETGPNLAFQCLGPDAIPVEVRAPLKPVKPRGGGATGSPAWKLPRMIPFFAKAHNIFNPGPSYL